MTSSTIICTLRFSDSMDLEAAEDGKQIGRWDSIAWGPLVTVATTLAALVKHLVASPQHETSCDRKSFSIQGHANATLGNDIKLMMSDEDNLMPERIASLQAACIDFCLQVLDLNDGASASLGLEGVVSDADQETIRSFVDDFRTVMGGRRIPEEFICIVGATEIPFTKRFGRKLVAATEPSVSHTVVGRIEGCEREHKRGNCVIVQRNSNLRQTINFEEQPRLLGEIRQRLWDNCYHEMNLLECSTANGKRELFLLAFGPCVESGTPLLPDPPAV